MAISILPWGIEILDLDASQGLHTRRRAPTGTIRCSFVLVASQTRFDEYGVLPTYPYTRSLPALI